MDGIVPELRTPVSLDRLAGTWKELARTMKIPYEDGTTDVTTVFAWDGRSLSVSSSGLRGGHAYAWKQGALRITNECNTRFEHIDGATWRILLLDFDAYEWMVIDDGKRQRVWVLARGTKLTRHQWKHIHEWLEDHFGVDMRTIEYTPHLNESQCALLPSVATAAPPRMQGGAYVIPFDD
jgi:lipocalin